MRPPCALMLRWAASRMRTTRRPAAPSVNGVRPGVATPHRSNTAWETAQQEIHNGKVVRSEVPEDVHVVLDEAQVDANAVDVIDVAERASVYQFLDLSNRGAVDERVVHHEHP